MLPQCQGYVLLLNQINTKGVRCPRKEFEDFTTGNFHSAHGVVAIGIWHLCRSVSELIKASDYLNEGL